MKPDDSAMSSLPQNARLGLGLVLILVVSVLLRVGCALYLGAGVVVPPNLNDQLSYHTLATRIITNHGFSFPENWYPYVVADTPTAFWSFGYPLFLAAVYEVFGVLPLVARFVQAVLGGILLPWMAFRLTRRLFSDPTDTSQRAKWPWGRPTDGSLATEVLGLLTAMLTAIYAYFALYAATLMTETFYITALLWSLERALAVRERLMHGLKIGVGLAVTLGLSLGIAVLLRQSILPWVAVLFIWLFWIGRRAGQSRDVLKTLATTIVPMALLVLPFTIRNYHVYGSFLLLNSNAGYAMYSAQHPMHGTEFQEFAAAPVPDELAGLNEAQLDRELMRRGIGFVAADPRRYLLLSLSRVPPTSISGPAVRPVPYMLLGGYYLSGSSHPSCYTESGWRCAMSEERAGASRLTVHAKHANWRFCRLLDHAPGAHLAVRPFLLDLAHFHLGYAPLPAACGRILASFCCVGRLRFGPPRPGLTQVPRERAWRETDLSRLE